MALSVADIRDKFANPNAAELELIARYAMLPEDGRRKRAFDAFAATGLPHRRMEAWKWTDFKAALKAVEASEKPAYTQALPSAEEAVMIRFKAGGVELPEALPKGIKLHRRDEAQALGDAEDIPLGAMTAALAARKGGLDTLLVEVTEAVSVPLHIICEGDRDETNFARVGITVRADASIDLIESHLGGAGFSSFLLEIGMQGGGRVSRTILQRGSTDEAQAITALIHLGEKSEYVQTALAFGAKVARLETRLVHQETESHATLNGAYLCADGYHADYTSHVRHGAPSCITRQTTKGAVLDGGTGVFQGKFFVPRIVGQHTDADMQHQALLLEDGAQIFAKPELEIYADDVECAHGNTSGALDPNQLFYMRQRGIPEAQARALLTEAFVAEALEEAHESVAEAMLAAAREFLSETVS
ncbi:SufD family Fe-S cluster assembly protein [Hyphomonas sp. FCG-A18]|uniref:SufB/SufD family protein n=1 Tax=Hyphomonas sp. FCG-A18 TaxID=3080019 RepID=UPI002B2B0FF9|nr:SufD family Fe-S cluster assembly protein [Hyphomonas sp. FCG-A18]